MKPVELGIVIVLSLIAAGTIFLSAGAFTPVTPEPRFQTYANDALGIAFAYPQGYVLSEGEIGSTGERHYVISLIRQEDAVPVEGGEGPTSVILDFYQNDAGKTLDDWLASDASNLRLGDGATAAVTVDGISATQFHWSGLYEGETTAFLHGNNIIAVSVAYFSLTDEIYSTYRAILSSLSLH